jgi:hypothetical protein
MKIQLPIDTSAVSFTDVMPPVLDRAGAHRDRGRQGRVREVPKQPFLNEGALGTSPPRPAERSCGPGSRW